MNNTYVCYRRRLEHFDALYDFLRERAAAYGRRGAHKAAAKLDLAILEAKQRNLEVLESSLVEKPEELQQLKAWGDCCNGEVIQLVEQLGRVHVSLVSKSTARAVSEVSGFIVRDPDLAALSLLIRHYFSA